MSRQVINEQPEEFAIPGQARQVEALPRLVFRRDRGIRFLAYRVDLDATKAEVDATAAGGSSDAT